MFQLYHSENELRFDKMRIVSVLY